VSSCVLLAITSILTSHTGDSPERSASIGAVGDCGHYST
jgi:hypothetical protein